MEPIHLAIELKAGENPPTERELFSYGYTETSKGTFLFDETAAALVLAAYKDQGNELFFDYDHKALDPMAPPEAGKAAGWFNLDIREGALWATNIRWTEPAANLLRNREYRYLSPAFYADEATSRVTRIVNVALTNYPATKRMRPLMNRADASKDTPMIELLSAKLGCEADEAACLTAVDAKGTQVAELSAQVEALTTMTNTAQEIISGAVAALSISEPSGLVDAISALLAQVREASEAKALAEERAAQLAADVKSREEAEAAAEVSFIATHGARYGIEVKSVKALSAYRAADPEGFATEFKAALDGRKANDAPHLFQKITIAEAPSASIEAGDDSAFYKRVTEYQEEQKRLGRDISRGVALSEVHREMFKAVTA